MLHNIHKPIFATGQQNSIIVGILATKTNNVWIIIKNRVLEQDNQGLKTQFNFGLSNLKINY